MAATSVIALGPAEDAERGVDISHTPVVTSEVNYLFETCRGMLYMCRYFFERSPGCSGENVE
jgi:hypothetical protein